MTSPISDGCLLVTGAAGRVGRRLVPELAPRRHLRLTDRSCAHLDTLSPFGEICPADLLDPAALPDVFQQMPAVLHLAGDGRQNAPWPALHQANVVGTYNAFIAALEAGCQRFIYASSAQAVGGYPEELEPLPESCAPWPRNLYGVTKAFGESMARMCAVSAPMSAVVLRIGAAVGAPPEENIDGLRVTTVDLVDAVEAALRWQGEGLLQLNVVSASHRLARSNLTTLYGNERSTIRGSSATDPSSRGVQQKGRPL